MSVHSAPWSDNLLYKSIAAAAAIIVLLKLNKLKLAKWLENILEVLLRDTKVNIADIEAVERNGVGVGARAVCRANLAILLSFGKLNNDRNT